MAINQAYINSLVSSLKEKRRDIARIIAINKINGIEIDYTIDLIKTDNIIEELLDYDISVESSPYQYIIDLEQLSQVNCNYIDEPNNGLVDFCEEPTESSDTVTVTKTIRKQYQTIGSTLSSDGVATGLIVQYDNIASFDLWADNFNISVGDGDKLRDAYFSDDGGTTAKEIDQLSIGDELYWNASIASVSLQSGDIIEFTMNFASSTVIISGGGGGGTGLVNLVDSGANVTNSISGTGYLQWDNIRIDSNIISAQGGATNYDLQLTPKGTGTVKTSSDHTTNIGEANDVITKSYADATYGSQGNGTTINISDGSGAWTASNLRINGYQIYTGTSNESVKLSGSSTGGNLTVYGTSHATKASFIELATNITPRLTYNFSSKKWYTDSLHTSNISAADDLVTKGYADANYSISFSSFNRIPFSNDSLDDFAYDSTFFFNDNTYAVHAQHLNLTGDIQNVSNITGTGTLSINAINIGSSVVGGNKTITVVSSSTNASLILTPKGTGTVQTSTAHTSNISGANDVITYAYAEANYANPISFGSNNQIPTVNVGTTDFDYSPNLTFDGNVLYLGNNLQIRASSLDFLYATAIGAGSTKYITGNASSDSGASAILGFKATYNDGTVSTRPLFDWKNNTTKVGEVSASGIWTLNATHTAGISANDDIITKGYADANYGGGSIGGSTGASDNAILRADGTGGSSVQNTGILISDSDIISGIDGILPTGSATVNLGGPSNLWATAYIAGIGGPAQVNISSDVAFTSNKTIEIPSAPTSTSNGALRYDNLGSQILEVYDADTASWISVGNSLTESTYTPTITATANIDSSTARTINYFRNGDQVTVYGNLDIDPTSADTYTTWRLSLPVASDFTQTWDLGGAGASTEGRAAYVIANVANDEAEFSWWPSGTTSRTISFQFTYIVK